MQTNDFQRSSAAYSALKIWGQRNMAWQSVAKAGAAGSNRVGGPTRIEQIKPVTDTT